MRRKASAEQSSAQETVCVAESAEFPRSSPRGRLSKFPPTTYFKEIFGRFSPEYLLCSALLGIVTAKKKKRGSNFIKGILQKHAKCIYYITFIENLVENTVLATFLEVYGIR